MQHGITTSQQCRVETCPKLELATCPTWSTQDRCPVPRATCHVSHRRSLEPRHHHPRLRQRRLLRLPHHHPDPLPLLPEVTVMMMMMMMMVWEQEARQGRGRHLQQLHHLQHRAGLSQHQPQFGEAHPGEVRSRVTCPLSRVTCQDILRHDDLTGLLGPSLAALKCAHGVTLELSATGQLVLTNTR